MRAAIKNEALPPIVAITASDFHISEKTPIARTPENNWFEAQLRNIIELRILWHIFNKVPLLVPGDIFNKWNTTPEAVNFALRELPACYAVPGNHDLPYHDYNSLDKSAYSTLIEADKVTNLEPGEVLHVDGVWLHGFPHGFKLGPMKKLNYNELDRNALHIAVIHQYLWSNEHNAHPGAKKDTFVDALHSNLRKYGYDVAVVGDNHQPFSQRKNRISIFNCGCFIPRNSNERNTNPRVGLIHADGAITTYHLTVDEDMWAMESQIKHEQDAIDRSEGVIDALTKLAETGLNFRETVIRYMNATGSTSKPVKKILLEILEDIS